MKKTAVVQLVASILLVCCMISGCASKESAAVADVYAEIEIEGYGTISLELDGKSAPITVENFVKLAESGFYDGLTFHRIMEGFMMQGGDPNGNGTGGSEETIVGEFAQNGHDNQLSHTRGAISMARAMAYDSASSQFFIVHEPQPHLDGRHTVFGMVTDNLEAVLKMHNGDRIKSMVIED